MKISDADKDQLTMVLFYLRGADTQFSEFTAHIGAALLGHELHYERIGTYLHEWGTLLHLAGRHLQECEEDTLSDWAEGFMGLDVGGSDIMFDPESEDWKRHLRALREAPPVPDPIPIVGDDE